MKKIKKIRMYIEIPFLRDYDNKIDYIPCYAGFGLSWSKHGFDICKCSSIFPKGHKTGKHLFTFTMGILYFTIKFTFYEPMSESIFLSFKTKNIT